MATLLGDRPRRRRPSSRGGIAGGAGGGGGAGRAGAPDSDAPRHVTRRGGAPEKQRGGCGASDRARRIGPLGSRSARGVAHRPRRRRDPHHVHHVHHVPSRAAPAPGGTPRPPPPLGPAARLLRARCAVHSRRGVPPSQRAPKADRRTQTRVPHLSNTCRTPTGAWEQRAPREKKRARMNACGPMQKNRPRRDSNPESPVP